MGLSPTIGTFARRATRCVTRNGSQPAMVLCLMINLCGLNCTVGDDLPNGVVNTQNPADVSLTPEESLARITVPEGFHVTLFAGEPDIRRPIAFDFDDRGRLWVVENYSHPKWKEDNATDRVVILEDSDNDGEFDKRTVFWDEGRYLTALAWGHGGVWLGNTPELTFIPDADHDDVPDGPPVTKLDGFQISTNNVVNNFHWGPDGWLYGAIGLSSKSLVGLPGASKKDRVQITRGIWRYHPVTARFEKLAEGMVNPWGADFNEYGDLFTANTVIAHLWHIVPGMYCERRASERDYPFAYSRVQTIANHLHWGGGQWQTSRNPSSRRDKKQPDAERESGHDEEYHRHSVAGGGHAHCGGMVYLGDNWPDEYRGTFFTNNLHGNRVNNDKLVPAGSTYIGEHADDLLHGNDPWFRGMSIKYGPDGGVYVSDWHDFGECHDSDGSHRSSGRIYKVTYGKPVKPSLNLQQQTNLQLAEFRHHRNEWQYRHARRILHERAIAGQDVSDVRRLLYEQLKVETDELIQLRIIWMLNAVDADGVKRGLAFQTHSNQHLRRWALRLYGDAFAFDNGTAGDLQPRFLDAESLRYAMSFAEKDSSPKVRLELACLLQRTELQHRHALAKALVRHAGDATDPYLPLMIWYGYAPAVEHDVSAALEVANAAKIPLVRQYIARRIAELGEEPRNQLFDAIASESDESRRLSMLQGAVEALEASGGINPPAAWSKVYQSIGTAKNAKLRAVGIRLAIVFGDRAVVQEMRRRILDGASSLPSRKAALQSLAGIRQGLSADLLHRVVETSAELRDEALTALVTRGNDDTPTFLVDQFDSFSDEQRRLAVSVLVTRRSYVKVLLEAITQGRVDRDSVSAFALQQLRSFPDQSLRQQMAHIWTADDANVRKSDEIARLTKLMTVEHLATGNAERGRRLFDRTCAKCHRLFGEGGTIAPDLTGSGRKKADYIIRNLVDPSAEIDAAYRLTTVITTDGRLFTGFIIKQDDSNLEFRTQDATVRLKMSEVDELATSNVSMMPEGMLKTLSDDEFRDLLVYLSGDEQVAPEQD